MKLTNSRSIFSQDQSCSLQKYFLSEDTQQLYNYSNSYNNETLLLETTEMKLKSSPQQQKKFANLLQNSNEKQYKSQSFLEDFYEQLQITISQKSFDNSCEQSKKQSVNQLYKMCQNMIGSLKKLQTKMEKIEKIECKDRKSKEQQSSKSPSCDSEKALSVLTYSSLKNSKGCKCEESNNSKILMSNLFEYVECRSKFQIYKQQNEQLKKQLIRLEVSNQDMKRTLKKLEMENLKVKQLLKQYQNFNKKKTFLRKDLQLDDYLNIQTANQYKRYNHVRANTLEDNYHHSRENHKFRNPREEKQNRQYYQYYQQRRTQDYHKLSPLTPNPFIRIEPYSLELGFQKTDYKRISDSMHNDKYEIEKPRRPTQKKIKVRNFHQYKNSQYKQRNISNQEQNQLKTNYYYPFDELLEQQNYEIIESHSINQQMDVPYAQTRKVSTCNDLDKLQNKVVNKSSYCSPNKIRSMKSESNLTIHKLNHRI